MIQAKSLQEMKKGLLATVQVTLPSVQVQDGFGKSQYFGRLDQPTVVLSLTEMSAQNGGFYGMESRQGGCYEQTGVLVDSTFCLTLYLPREEEADSQAWLQSVCVALACESDGDFYQFELSPIQFSEPLQCFESSLQVHGRWLLVKETEVVTIRAVQVTAE